MRHSSRLLLLNCGDLMSRVRRTIAATILDPCGTSHIRGDYGVSTRSPHSASPRCLQTQASHPLNEPLHSDIMLYYKQTHRCCHLRPIAPLVHGNGFWHGYCLRVRANHSLMAFDDHLAGPTYILQIVVYFTPSGPPVKWATVSGCFRSISMIETPNRPL